MSNKSNSDSLLNFEAKNNENAIVIDINARESIIIFFFIPIPLFHI
jgi:hypothetical protein